MAKSYLDLPVTFPIGIRRNNPGNLTKSGAAFAGVTTRPDTKRGMQFFAFVDVPHGLLAMSQLLTGYIDRQGLNTLTKISGKYLQKNTSTVERNRWVVQVSRNTGFSPKQFITTSPADLKNLCLGIIMKEVGLIFKRGRVVVATITSADYDEAMDLQAQLVASAGYGEYDRAVAQNVALQLDYTSGSGVLV